MRFSLRRGAMRASVNVTPAVYEKNGKQYMVIACGCGKGTKSGDAYVAFALPD